MNWVAAVDQSNKEIARRWSRSVIWRIDGVGRITSHDDHGRTWHVSGADPDDYDDWEPEQDPDVVTMLADLV